MAFYLLPFNRFILTSPRAPEDILKVLQQNTGVKEFRLFRRGSTYFQGEVTENRFILNRTIRYGNAFLPIIKGNISQQGKDTCLTMTMAPRSFVSVFLIVWFSFTIIGGASTIYQDIIKHETIYSDLSHLAIMLIFAIILVNVSFWLEAKLARRKLEELIVPASTLAD